MYFPRTVIPSIFLCLCLTETILCACQEGLIVNCDSLEDAKNSGEENWSHVIIQKTGRFYKNPNSILNNDVFNKTKNLKEISIYRQLIEINPNSFQDLPQLKRVRIRDNKLTVLKKSIFSGFFDLEELDLENNEIENIVHGAFADSNIISINLSNNKLNNLQEGQLSLEHLEKLSLANNPISFIAPGALHPNLKSLSLRACNITTLPTDALASLFNLRELDLSRNKLTSIVSPAALKKLEKFNLSKNELKTLPAYAFEENLALTHLYLGYNKITKLENHWFPDNNSLIVIHFQKNLLTGLSYDLGTKWGKVREVALGGNPWPCSCLQHLKTYIAKYNVRQTICEEKYFGIGKDPICISVEVAKCDDSQVLDDKYLIPFLQATSNFKC